MNTESDSYGNEGDASMGCIGSKIERYPKLTTNEFPQLLSYIRLFDDEGYIERLGNKNRMQSPNMIFNKVDFFENKIFLEMLSVSDFVILDDFNNSIYLKNKFKL